MTKSTPKFFAKSDLLIAVLLIAPLWLVIGKAPILPTSPFLSSFLSLSDLPHHLHVVVKNVLFVPLGALVVVLFRLTLGIPVLGLFRPILIAIAFDIIGIPIGVTFLFLTLVVIVLLRPLLASDHSYARVAVLLSLVAAILLVPLILGKWWDIEDLRQISQFPVIALCLTCESFAKVVDRQGLREAMWRTTATVIAAALIMVLTTMSGILELFLRFPELLLIQAGAILLISKHLDLRLFEGINPLAIRPAPDPIETMTSQPDAVSVAIDSERGAS